MPQPTGAPATPTAPPAGVKARQQAMWASGDFAVIGTTLQIVGEMLAEAAEVNAGERVLDVAAGNGNATLAAARRFAQVTVGREHHPEGREHLVEAGVGEPPMASVASPLLWGTDAHLATLFAGASKIQSTPRFYNFRYESPEHFVDMFRAYYGPTHKAFAALPPDGQAALAADLLAMLCTANVSATALVAPGEYLETVITR